MLVHGNGYTSTWEMLSMYKYHGETNAEGPTQFDPGYMTLLKTVINNQSTIFVPLGNDVTDQVDFTALAPNVT